MSKSSTLAQLKEDLELQTKAYNILKIRAEGARKRLDEAKEAFQAACPHKETERDGQYFSGGYDYTAETIYTTKCLLCDKVLDIEHKSHSWYG